MIKKNLCFVFLVVLVEWTSFGVEPFFQDGRTVWKIYLSPQAEQTETYAAQELQVALKKISGADFDVISGENHPEANVIIIGDLKNPEVQAQSGALKLSPGKVEEVAVYTLGGRLYLAGNQPRGALYAVYSFLQRELGVRWLWPGADGEFIPAKTSWSLPELKFNHRPGFQYRGFHLCGDNYLGPDSEIFREWMARNFINIYRHAAPLKEKRRGFYSMWSSHNVRLPPQLFETHPEYFAQIDGKRYKGNICFSNPEVDKIIATDISDQLRKTPWLDILSVFPLDNQDYCRCIKCAQMDVSTAWFEFYNRLTDTLKQEFPGLKLAAVAYQGFRSVPKCRIRNSEFVEYCSYDRCNIHPYGQAGCKQNEMTMNEMLAWQATGLPIGNYAYDYDICTKNQRFYPFLSMTDDAIKTGRKLGHVTMIPEVLLISPKYIAPEEYIFNVQNRLPIYLYARLLWDPDQKMPDILRDWCRTAFNEAADPMFDYYMRMDRAWSAMPAIHPTILGDGLTIAPYLLAGKLQDEVASDFIAAEQRLPKIANQAFREATKAAIRRERYFFNQWQQLYWINADVPRLNLPLLAQTGDFTQSASRPQEFMPTGSNAKIYSTRVSLAWTKDALLVKWVCREPKMKQIKAVASSRDGKVVEDDSVELVLSSGVAGETWHFAVNTKGVQQDFRDSTAMGREVGWDPDWKSKIQEGPDFWEAEMMIPFASLAHRPASTECWRAGFLRHNGGRQDFASSVFPERDTVLLFFSSVPRSDRSLLRWVGNPKREDKWGAALNKTFAEIGWQLHLVTDGEKLISLHDQCDAYWFRGPGNVPAEYWQKYLIPALKNGALVGIGGGGDMPLERYFNDPSFKVKALDLYNVPLAGRRAQFIAPGDWSSKPYDLLTGLKKGITPAAGYLPADPAAWTVLATAPSGGESSVPYLLVRPYGKGLLVLFPDSIHRVQEAQLFENLVTNQKTLAHPNGEGNSHVNNK